MKRFDEYMKHFSEVEGWFQTPAIAIWDSLLSHQEEQRISGNMIEIGVWKGSPQPWLRCIARLPKSAPLSTLCPWTAPRRLLAKSCHKQLAIICKNNRSFWPAIRLLPKAPVVFAGFVDGEHTGQSVINDLEIADHLLSDRGIAVFDDFFSPGYP